MEISLRHFRDVVQSKAEAEWEMQLMDHLLSQLPTYEDKVLRHVQIQALLAKNFYLQPPVRLSEQLTRHDIMSRYTHFIVVCPRTRR